MEKGNSIYQKTMEALDFLKERAPGFKPEIAVTLGSGLGGFGKRIECIDTIDYSEIPYFKSSKIEGHAGKLLIGKIHGKNIVCQQGRYHLYEGHSPWDIVFPIRLLAKWGIRISLVTNAAGGINLDYQPGDIMLITDHINGFGTNPLVGEPIPEFGPQFPDMTHAYDDQLSKNMIQQADIQNITLQQGVYLGTIGPSYETPAEIRMFRTLGADAVGMSTVFEVIAAHHMGVRVVGLSCITNAAAGVTGQELSHEEVQQVSLEKGDSFENLVEGWIKSL